MEPYIGMIMLWPVPFAPMGWAYCDGSLISIASNQALFALIGTTYGGNGTTNFGLPDLRGRVPVGAGSGPNLSPVNLSEQGGLEQVTLTTAQMPAHNHTVSVATATTASTPVNNLQAPVAGESGNMTAFGTAAAGTFAPNAVSMVGNGGAHENRQPYLGLNFIIALEGLFPTRP